MSRYVQVGHTLFTAVSAHQPLIIVFSVLYYLVSYLSVAYN